MFGLLFPHLFLKFHSSGLKFIQSLFQIGDFLLDLAKLCLFLDARQTILAKLFGDVLLKLTSQTPEICATGSDSSPVVENTTLAVP